MPHESKDQLAEIARRIRLNIIRQVAAAGSGHPGGSLSATDILTVLYFRHLRHDPKNPEWADRDRFILSKGHATPLLYATLAEAGYFDSSLLDSFRQLGSPLQGHPVRNSVPGIEMSTGALGQGLSIANGVAMGLRLNGSDATVFVMMGDGEVQEGMIWEAAMTASHYQLDNLVGILDLNGIQIDGFTADVMDIEPIADKWRAFGWHVSEIAGHDLSAIDDAIRAAKQVIGKPAIIIAKTVKGKGVSYMENNVKYHGSAPSPALAEQAIAELSR